jgi:hypothetical protein
VQQRLKQKIIALIDNRETNGLSAQDTRSRDAGESTADDDYVRLTL